MQETSPSTFAEVSYIHKEPFDIDCPPSKPFPHGATITHLGAHRSERTTYEPDEEEFYDRKKKKVKKEKSSGRVSRWFKKHGPSCCICVSGSSSKFDQEEAERQVYDI